MQIADQKKLGTWLISFLLAVLVWFIIVNNKEYTVNMEIPIIVYEPREDKILKKEIPKTAIVRFKGKGRAFLASKLFKEPALILDVANIQEEYHISLNEYYKKYPNRVDYSQDEMEFIEVIYPDTFTIYIDDKISRTLPIQLNYSAKPAQGYLFAGDPIVSPDYVTLSGPKSLLQSITGVNTELLNLGNIDKEMVVNVKLINPYPELISLSQNIVQVTFKVESIGERTFTQIPVQVINAPDNITVNIIPSHVSLTIIGSNNYIQSLSSDSIQVIFNYSEQWIPAKIYYQPEVKVPKKVISWKNLKPSRVEVAIVRK